MTDYFYFYGVGAGAEPQPDAPRGQSDAIYDGGHEPFEVMQAQVAGAVRQAADDRLGHLQIIPGIHPAHAAAGHTPIMGDVEIGEAGPGRIGKYDIEIEARR